MQTKKSLPSVRVNSNPFRSLTTNYKWKMNKRMRKSTRRLKAKTVSESISV